MALSLSPVYPVIGYSPEKEKVVGGVVGGERNGCVSLDALWITLCSSPVRLNDTLQYLQTQRKKRLRVLGGILWSQCL